MRIWVDRDALLGAHHRGGWSKGTRGEDQGHQGMAGAEECDGTSGICGDLHLLLKVRQGIFPTCCTPYRPYQKGGIQLDGYNAEGLRQTQGGDEQLSGFGIPRFYAALFPRVRCNRGGDKRSFDAGRPPHSFREPEAIAT